MRDQQLSNWRLYLSSRILPAHLARFEAE